MPISASRPSDDGRWIETRVPACHEQLGRLLPDHLMMVDGLKPLPHLSRKTRFLLPDHLMMVDGLKRVFLLTIMINGDR